MDSVYSRLSRYFDGASTARTVQGWARTICNRSSTVDTTVPSLKSVDETVTVCSDVSAAKAGRNGVRTAMLFLLCQFIQGPHPCSFG